MGGGTNDKKSITGLSLLVGVRGALLSIVKGKAVEEERSDLEKGLA
jgi:hypothetical protein